MFLDLQTSHASINPSHFVLAWQGGIHQRIKSLIWNLCSSYLTSAVVPEYCHRFGIVLKYFTYSCNIESCIGYKKDTFRDIDISILEDDNTSQNLLWQLSKPEQKGNVYLSSIYFL